MIARTWRVFSSRDRKERLARRRQCPCALVCTPLKPPLGMQFDPLVPSTRPLLYLIVSAACFLLLFWLQRPSSKPNQALNDSKSQTTAHHSSNSSPLSSPTSPRIPTTMILEPVIDRTLVKQAYDAFLVLDVEATCVQGADFNYPNEIIEWPVLLLRWKDKDITGKANKLEVVDEFRSFVKPVWRPQLSPFCTALTGITQDDVDSAPHFSTVLLTFRDFLTRHGLIDPLSGTPLVKFCWCTDGPWDVRDFVVKQCFISKIQIPIWLSGDVMDVRRLVARWQDKHDPHRKPKVQSSFAQPQGTFLPITRQLHLLGLSPFEGRQHCGIDDTRNVARIVIELARRGMRLRPNTPINPNRRWPWMGKYGKILEYQVFPAPVGSAML
ncbi:3'-5' Exoribonuclease [Abortiporus biennis]